MKLIRIIVAVLTVVILGGSSLVSVQAVELADPCSASSGNSAMCEDAKDKDRLPAIAKNIINTMLFVVGLLAVIMIIFAGLRYVMSSGDKKRIEQSKQILIYSITGLIVAILAFAIVNFVIDKLK